MANHNYGRNRNRSGFNQEWDNRDNINFPTTNIDNRPSRARPTDRTREYGIIYNNDRDRAGNRDGYDNNSNSNNDWNNTQRNYQDRDNNRNSGREDYRNDQQGDSRYSRNQNQWTNTRYDGENYERGNNNDQRDSEERDWWDRTKDEVSSWFGDDDAQRRRSTDERRGEHRGKGPKGYTRSDDRIKDDVNDRLSDDTNVDASDIEVMVEACDVTLTGTVKSRWEKRQAEDLAESISGVKNVENRLRVTSAATQAQVPGNDADGIDAGAGNTPAKKSQIGTYQTSKS